MNNEVKSVLLVIVSMIFLTIFAFTETSLYGVIAVIYAVFSVEYGIKQAIDDKEAE